MHLQPAFSVAPAAMKHTLAGVTLAQKNWLGFAVAVLGAVLSVVAVTLSVHA